MSGPYHPLASYPVLTPIIAQWQTLKDEAVSALKNATWTILRDNRVDPDIWGVLPILPEPEDRPVVPGWEKNRSAAPRTAAMVEAEPAIKAYSLSYLRPGGYIRPHTHQNPFVTAILTLQTGPDCYMIADGQRREFREDEVIVFDYRRVHEARNNSDVTWLALLLLLDPAKGG